MKASQLLQPQSVPSLQPDQTSPSKLNQWELGPDPGLSLTKWEPWRMTFRKFSLFCVAGLVVVGASILAWYLMTRDTTGPDTAEGNLVNIDSSSNGVHVVEGELNQTNIFSGDYIGEIVTGVLLLLAVVTYKIVCYKCKPAPIVIPATTDTTQPPPAAPVVPAAPHAVPAPPYAYQQVYCPPPPTYQMLAEQAAHAAASATVTGNTSVKYSVRKPKEFESGSESYSDDSDDTTTSVAVAPPKKRRRRRRKPDAVTNTTAWWLCKNEWPTLVNTLMKPDLRKTLN